MDWQQIVSLLIVAAALGGLLWGRFHRRKFNFARDTHCGCSTTNESASRNSIIFHARKGEPSSITVKMK